MKTYLLLVSLFLITVCTFAQNLRTVYIPRGARAENTTIIDGIATHSYTTGNKIKVNGTPYLYKDFKPGKLELKDGKTSADVLLRYDVSKDQFEINYNNDTLVLNKPYEVENIILGNRIFIYDPRFMETGERKRNGYFEILMEGNLSLYMKRNKKLSYDSFVSTYKGGGGTKEYFYDDKTTYFCKLNDGKPFLLSSSKSLLNRLTSNKQPVKQFIKQNRIKFKKEGDIIKLIEFYNSL